MKTTIHFFPIKQISAALLLLSVSNNANAMLGRLIGRPLVRRPMVGIRACQAPAGDEKSKDELQALKDKFRENIVRGKIMCENTMPVLINSACEVVNALEKENKVLLATNAALKEEMAENEIESFYTKERLHDAIYRFGRVEQENNNLIAINASLEKENADLKKSSPQRNENEILK
jgi:Ni,Fe-hydrogenase III component G